jgi:hypothetical protein
MLQRAEHAVTVLVEVDLAALQLVEGLFVELMVVQRTQFAFVDLVVLFLFEYRERAVLALAPVLADGQLALGLCIAESIQR